MRKIFFRLLNLGIHHQLSPQKVSRVRVTNFLEIVSIVFFLLYLSLSLAVGSFFLVALCGAMAVVGAAGLWLNHRRRYGAAQFMMLNGFSLLLLVGCNSVNVGKSFAIFYFPVFAAYAVYVDLKSSWRSASLNASLTFALAICAISLPPHLLFSVDLEPEWVELLHYLNYPIVFAVTAFYIAYTMFHINQNAEELIESNKATELQKFELMAAKLKAEGLALAQTRFVSNMSHELRTPLNGIIGTVQLLLQEKNLPHQQDYFDVLKFSSEHMLSLVNNVLDFSKIEAGKVELAAEPFNLRHAMRKIATVFEGQFAGKGLHFSAQIDERLDKSFIGDETRLAQVVNNLVGNALKFTAAGGVTLRVQLQEADSGAATVLFSVRDTGVGIEEERLSTIFKAFDQGHAATNRTFGGTGLGLTISKQIVSLMDSNLQVTSAVGQGTEFFFTLRITLNQVPASFVNDEKVGALKSLKGIRVLVAEDSPVNMIITRKFLQRWDVQIEEATNGREALQALEKQRFGILLIDLDMPVMDGYETVAELRKTDPHTPAIAFTAAVLPNMRESLRQKGFTDFLQKPFRPEDLHKKMTTYGLVRPDEAAVITQTQAEGV